MTGPELAEHIEMLQNATIEDIEEFLEDLLEEPYAELEQQNN